MFRKKFRTITPAILHQQATLKKEYPPTHKEDSLEWIEIESFLKAAAQDKAETPLPKKKTATAKP